MTTEENKKEKEDSSIEVKEKKDKVKTEKSIEQIQKTEEKKEETERESIKIPVKFKKIVEEIEKMSVIELNELVKVFEEKFGVSAQASVMAPSAGGAGDDGGEEQNLFTVELTASGSQKIAVIKMVKGLLGLGLKEAKDAVDGVPSILKEGVKKEEAEEMKKKIEEVGGAVTLK